MMRQAGITLLEMLVVMMLIGLLASVATPSVTAGMETVKLRSAAERLAATLRLARVRAVRTRHYFQVTVDPRTRRVELRDLEGEYVRDWETPVAVNAECGMRNAECPNSFVFPPDGSVPGARLVLENARNRRLAVDLDAFTGLPAVKELPQ
jgi:type II secretion system protein H